MKSLRLAGFLVLAVCAVTAIGCKGPAAVCPPTTPMAEMKHDGTEVLATIKGTQLTEGELLAQPDVKMKLYEASLRVYEAEEKEREALKAAVEEYLQDKLLSEAAKAKGVTVEEYIKTEVDGKVQPPSDAEIKKFYEERKINRPLDTIKDKISEYLANQKVAEARKAYIERLMKDGQIAITVPAFNKAKPLPPHLDVAVDKASPVRGSAKAPITIVAFSDYQCPYCKRAEDTVNEVLKKYKDSVKLVFRFYPLPFHREAKPAAIAALCAKDQDKFWQYHDELFNNQSALKDTDLVDYAKKLKLNEKKFNECVSSKKFEAFVDKDMEEGKKLGVTGTPAYFINGRMLSGARPFEDFDELIRYELQAKKKQG